MRVDLPLDKKKTVENKDWATGPLGRRATRPLGLRAAGPVVKEFSGENAHDSGNSSSGKKNK